MSTRILIIEDNQVNLYLMDYLLKAHGYEVLSAENGAEGVEKAIADPPDLIICDVQMPVMDGYTVAAKLKADPRLRDVPLLAVTAHAMVGDRQKILDAGFDGYFTKPIDPESFVKDTQAFLPGREHREPTRDPAAGDGETPSHRYTVLVVDNEPVNLMLACSLLERSDYRVISAHGMSMALALARESSPDLILSDVCMEEGSGFDFVTAVRADPKLKQTCFIFLTSTMTTEQARRKGLSLGADKFLFRPIDVSDLLREIRECLEQARD